MKSLAQHIQESLNEEEKEIVDLAGTDRSTEDDQPKDDEVDENLETGKPESEEKGKPAE